MNKKKGQFACFNYFRSLSSNLNVVKADWNFIGQVYISFSNSEWQKGCRFVIINAIIAVWKDVNTNYADILMIWI